jgi:hypothetical protein
MKWMDDEYLRCTSVTNFFTRKFVNPGIYDHSNQFHEPEEVGEEPIIYLGK